MLGQTDERADGRTLYRFIDSAPRTVWARAVPIAASIIRMQGLTRKGLSTLPA